MRPMLTFTFLLFGSFSAVHAEGFPAKRTTTPLYAVPQSITPMTAEKDLPQLKNWIIAVIHEASKRGSEIYNQGAHSQCYFYYQATLLGVFPFLTVDKLTTDKDLPRRVQRALYRVSEVQDDWEAALILRTALNDIRNRLEDKTLWYRLGGSDTVHAIVKYAFDEAAKDDSGVNLTRDGDYPYTPRRQERMEEMGIELIKSATDKINDKGPKYTGRTMKEVHSGMKITSKEMNAARKCLERALYYYCVPETDAAELLKMFDSTKADIVGP